MTNPERIAKIRELLKNAGTFPYNPHAGKGTMVEYLLREALSLLDGIETEGAKWISVKDRLPEDNKQVEIYCEDNDVRLGWYDTAPNSEYREWTTTGNCYSQPKYWRKFEEPPINGEEPAQ